MQLEFDIFPYLVHKFIMKNTAAPSCSNIVLQKKNSSVQSNSLSSDNYKGQNGWAKSGKGNWVQTKKINTIKLNGIPWKQKQTNKFQNKYEALVLILKMFFKLQWLFAAILIYSHAE